MQKNNTYQGPEPEKNAETLQIPPHLPPDQLPRLPPHIRRRVEEAEFLEKTAFAHEHTRAASKLYSVGAYVLLALCGALFSLAYAKFNLSFIAWFGLVPLFFLTFRRSSWSVFARSLVFFGVWACITFSFLRDIHWGAVPPLALIMALYNVAAMVCAARFYTCFAVGASLENQTWQKRKLAYELLPAWRQFLLILSTALFFTAFEYLRSFLFTGLPWNTFASTQWQNIPLLQLAEFTGLYGITFFVVAINAGIYFSVCALIRWVRCGRYASITPLLCTLLLMMVCIITVSNRAERFMPPENAALDARYMPYKFGVYQASEPAFWTAVPPDAAGKLNRALNYSQMCAARDKPDVILWPETLIPVSYLADYPGARQFRKIMTEFISKTNIPMLIGVPDVRPNIDQNSVFLIGSDGAVSDSYAKNHLVPFGEYIPFSGILDKLFPGLRTKFNININLQPGNRFEPLTLPKGIRAGVNICYEDVFDYVSRYEVLNGAQVLLTVTNDAWYPQSDEREQHLVNAIFRAVENRRYVVRTGNMAPACVIDPAGRISDHLRQSPLSKEPFDPMTKHAASGTFELFIDTQPPLTFFTRYGNIFAQSCLFIGAFLVAFCFFTLLKIRAELKARRLSENENNALVSNPKETV